MKSRAARKGKNSRTLHSTEAFTPIASVSAAHYLLCYHPVHLILALKTWKLQFCVIMMHYL